MKKAMKILVAEDCKAEREGIIARLSRLDGAEFYEADNGREALDVLSMNSVDIVLTDMQMPVIDGLELLDAIQRMLPKIPVVLLTAKGSEAIAVQALQQGAASYVPKRALEEVLLPTICQIHQITQAKQYGQAQYFSCFISHSSEDVRFCQRLWTRLRQLGIQTWFAPQDMKGGARIVEQVLRAIREYDKLLLVLSQYSMKSSWVMTEVIHATKKEEETGRRVLFPIRLVDFPQVQQWQLFDTDSGRDIAREVREYHIPDFSDWHERSVFAEACESLSRDLLKEAIRDASD